MTDLYFSSHQLIIGNGPTINKEALNKIFKEERVIFEYKKNYHIVETSVVDDRFFWIYSNYGKPLPRTNHIIDTETHEKTDNPRKKEQIEPKEQLFAIYDDVSRVFYISDQRQRSFLEDFLKHKAENDVVIKNQYKNVDEFLDEITSVETISFTGFNDLFSTGGDLMTPLKNIFGYAEPAEFYIKAKYSVKKNDLITNWIKSLFGKKESAKLKTLVCIGRDDSGMEKIFNTSSFINKIGILTEKDDQSLFM